MTKTLDVIQFGSPIMVLIVHKVNILISGRNPPFYSYTFIVKSLQPMFTPEGFNISPPLSGGCSEGLYAFRHFLKYHILLGLYVAVRFI